MTAIPRPLPPTSLRRLQRFARTPKGLVLLLFAGLLAFGMPMAGVANVAPGLVAAVAGAAAVDLVVTRFTRGRWVFPDGAIISGLRTADAILMPT